MSKPSKFSNKEKTVQIAFLLGVCFLLYFLNLGRWDLWAPDEPRYAQIAKEIVNGGDWILMHINGGVYGDKPPLFFWFIALSSYLWKGFSSFSVRFPSALFGTLTVLLVFCLGGKLYSFRTGFFSSLILATSLLFAHFATRANIDATLTFFTTAALLCFYLWHGKEKSEETRPHRRINSLLIYGFYVSMAFATLAKGPIGILFPLSISILYLFVRKDYREIKRMKLVPGIFLMLAIVIAWYLPAVWMGGKTYAEQHLFRHTIQAYRTGWTHPQPIYYYLYSFPVGFLPWIFFLPSAIAYGWSRLTIEKRKEFLFLFIWFVAIFAFFSFSKSKRSVYLLPLFPAASLMVGAFWSDLIGHLPDGFRRAWVSIPLYGFAALGLFTGIAIPIAMSIKFPAYQLYAIPVAFLLAASSLTFFILYRRENYRAVLLILIGVMLAGYGYTFGLMFPLENSRMSARFISEEITSRMDSGDRLAVFRGVEADPYNYYTGVSPISIVLTPDSLHQYMKSRGRVFCLLKFRDFSHLFGKQGDPEVRLIARRRIRSDDIVLISNR